MKGIATYDIAIAGGGLGGLSLAILQALNGKNVVLFEKNKYPFHKVCGEYISLESLDFLQRIGVVGRKHSFPIIKNLQVSSPGGKSLKARLPLGGIGISRFWLDNEMAKLARSLGVEIQEKTTVKDIQKKGEEFVIITDSGETFTKMALGAFGKRSNPDIKWTRPFIEKNRKSLNNYIGVKYHIKYDFPKDLIALHNFKDGYCGISAIENDAYCLCYMTTAANLQKCGGNIIELENTILSKNPFLKDIFINSKSLFTQPLVISQISFEKKEQSWNGIPLIGDAAGLIAPLCGNGMSMAMHSAVILDSLLKSAETNQNLENLWSKAWDKQFSTRLFVGRVIQSLFGNETNTELIVRFFNSQPYLLQRLISMTHGSAF